MELAWSKAIFDAAAEAAPLVEQAVAERIVPPGFNLVLEVVDGLTVRGERLREKEIPLERLRRYLVKERLPVLIQLQGEQVSAFVEMADEVTREAMVSGWSRSRYLASIDRVAGLFGTDGFRSAYADVWYNTYVLNAAYNEAQLEMVQNTVVGRLFPFLRLKTQRDERVRRSHREVDGLTARSFWPGWQRFTPPLDWNCFLEGTVVAGRFVGGSKARYSGKAVDLKTSGGNRLRVTPNHPVLTARGLIAASEIKKGDHLLRYLWDVKLAFSQVGGLVNEQNPPATVEQVFDSLSAQTAGRASSFYRPSNLDLHGDSQGVVGEVEVVGTYRKLSLQRDASLAEVVSKRGLASERLGEVAVSGSGPLGSLGGGSLSPGDSGPSSGTLALDSLSVILDESPLQEFRFGSASEFDVPFAEDMSQSSTAHAEFIRQAFERLPDGVSLDECVSVDWFDFDGHVYDFESPLGWIVADNIFTSNCRCYLEKISWATARRLGLFERIPDGSSIRMM